MAFRLILVGMVTSLGFDLPTGREVEDWGRGCRTWIEARVSEFQARQSIGEGASARLDPADHGGPVDDLAFAAVLEEVVSALAAEGKEPVLDLGGTSAPVAGEPGPVGDELALDLNRGADGLSEPAEPAPAVAEAAGDPTDETIGGNPGLAADPVGLEGLLHAASVPELGDSSPAVADLVASLDDSRGLAEVAAELSAAIEADRPAESSGAEAGAQPVAPEPEVADPAPEGPGGDSRLAQAVRLTGQAVHAWMALLQSGVTVAPGLE